ncbi:MAG: hypothetical protein M1837_006990 [Sclerophora amabilis]|nr:MAG: hypothetical protein M1837_006990 [Sclerophora amabilis]
MSSLRQRNVKEASPPPSPPSPDKLTQAEDAVSISVTDVLRILGGLLLLSSVLSYFITNDSVLWNYRPSWTYLPVLKAWLRGPLDLTDAQLASYDGTDPTLPILLAVNGTIYDVSASPQSYGPGGSYHFFAGRDATRAFVTGCFDSDLVPDMRGVEEMFLPLDYDDIGGDTGERVAEEEKRKPPERKELKLRKEREKREAFKKVRDAVGHWVGFFEKSEKYSRVGKVLREDGWEERMEKRDLCQQAQKGRKKRGQEKGGK